MTKRTPSDPGYVGYKVPPEHSRFKPGNREYLKRKKRTRNDNAAPFADGMRSFLTEAIPYRIGSKARRGRRIDVHLLMLKKSALKGDLIAIEELITLRESSTSFPTFEKLILIFNENEACL